MAKVSVEVEVKMKELERLAVLVIWILTLLA